jgi:tetratricopeptide (TPR) repeat protein
MRCSRCGVESPLAYLFVRRQKSFSLGKSLRNQWICPRCSNRDKDAMGMVLFLAGGVLPLVLILISVGNHVYIGDGFAVDLFLVCVLGTPCLVAHELGHAIAAWLVGFKVLQITIGRGRQICHWTFRGTQFDFRAFPVIGSVLPATLRMSAWRRGYFVIIAGGPMMNLLILLGATAIAWCQTLPPGASRWQEPSFWLSLAGANACLLIGNAANGLAQFSPFAEPASNDFRKMIRLLSQPVPSEDNRRASYYLTCGSVLLSADDCRGAEQMYARGLQVRPDGPFLRAGLAQSQLGIGDYASARENFSLVLGGEVKPAILRASASNGLAWADLLLGDPALSEEADRASSDAYTLTPWEPAVQNTRGWALVERGQLEEGSRLLRLSLRGVQTKRQRADVYCTLAIAEAHSGRLEESRRILDKARRMGPDSGLLALAQRVIDAIN